MSPCAAESTISAWLFSAGIAASLAFACGSPPSAQLPKAMASATGLATTGNDPDAFRNKRPATGRPAAVHFPTPEFKVLKSGVTLYVVPKASAVVTLSVVVRHGRSSFGPGQSGLAALTARMMTEGTKAHSSVALAEASESLGSALEADAGRDESHLGIETLTRDAVRGLSLLAEVVFTPAFSELDFARVKGEWLDELRAERQQPARVASLVALRALLGPRDGAPVSGSIADVEHLAVRDLVAFHRHTYVPSNLAVIAVGDVTLSGLVPDAERLFGRASGPQVAASAPTEIVNGPTPLRLLIVDRKDSVQTSIFAAQRFPKRSDPGFEAREVMTSVVGGLFTSRLNLNLREEHAFTYGVHADAAATREWGAFFVATEVKTETTADALVELLAELDRARDPKHGRPIESGETERARTDLIHSLGARLEHTSAIADSVRTLFTQRLPVDYYAKFPDLVARIPTVEVAQQAARLDPQHLLVVLVGDRARIEPDLKRRDLHLEAADPTLLE